MPKYQTQAVEAYLKQGEEETALPEQDSYNKRGRGYPDLAALGGVKNAYCVDTTLFGNVHAFEGIGGTSASCPATAALFARLNAQRIEQGLSALGFLNPFIYQNQQAFYDVAKGNNNWEGGSGFQALEGWDPATGVGTPNFEKLLAAAMAAKPVAPQPVSTHV
jgi:tripeptidyl-peptidase-1